MEQEFLFYLGITQQQWYYQEKDSVSFVEIGNIMGLGEPNVVRPYPSVPSGLLFCFVFSEWGNRVNGQNKESKEG